MLPAALSGATAAIFPELYPPGHLPVSTLTDSCGVLAQLQPCGLLMQVISHDALRPSRGLLRLCSSSICMSMLMSRKAHRCDGRRRHEVQLSAERRR
ncbi:hypothetical protein AOLI_G00039950 [Acnodon oligacanthus]